MTFIQALKKQKEKLSAAMVNIAREATFAAVEAATEKTPPISDVKGTHTRSGALKAHWATDSMTEPKKRARELVTTLRNNMYYASYVNDGHRMDRHFVPGLYINPFSDQLEYDAARKDEVGIMVGTQTDYVEGLYMAEAGDAAYGATVKAMAQDLEDILNDVFGS